jgi:hypothetical protein
MSKARKLADLGNQIDDGAITGTNMVVNGAMQVAQRNSSAVSVSNGSNEGYQTLDRFEFQYGNSAGGVANISQDTTVPSGYGFSNSYKVDVTTADTSLGSNHQIYISYRVEAQDMRNSGWNYTDPSSFITCSFWARSVKAGTYCFALRANDSASTRIFVKEFDLVADTWKKVIITISGEAGLAFNNDNGIGATLTWSLQAEAGRATATDDTWNSSDTSLATSNQVNFFDSTSNNFFLTGVCLNVGDSAIAFPHESYAETLAKCQRYFEIVKPETGQQASGIAVGYHLSTTEAAMHYFYKVRKRTEPDFTVTGQSNIRINHTGTSRNISSGTITISSASGVDTARMVLTGASGSLGDGDGSSMGFVGDGSLQFNAEL